MQENLIPIPRIPSGAPNKNTIEWEIPEKVKVVLMVISERKVWTVIAVIPKTKKHWWSRSVDDLIYANRDVTQVIERLADFLEKHGYIINPDTIKFGEIIGWGLSDEGSTS